MITGLVVIPLTLFILPADFFDHGEVICPSKRFLNLECVGCGITRGIQHALHLDFKTAWMYNKLVFIVLPIGIFIWVHLVGLYVFDRNLWVALKGKIASVFK